jgi:hypothetical protein
MPLIFTGPANVIDKLERVYRASMPMDMATSQLDEARVFAEMVALAEGQGYGLARETRLSTSHGIWTDQHARDRALWRQSPEADAELIARLRRSPDAVTYQAVYDAIDLIVKAVDATAVWYLIRIPVDAGAFADVDCWCDADSRVTPTRQRMTVALIPAPLGIRAGVLDALRSKMPVGHLYNVEEF